MSSRTRARAVWSLEDNGATNHHHHHRQRHQLQTALARVLDELGPVKISSEQLRKVEKKSNRLVTAKLKKIKKCHILTIFPVLGKLTHMWLFSLYIDPYRQCVLGKYMRLYKRLSAWNRIKITRIWKYAYAESALLRMKLHNPQLHGQV